MKRNANIYYKVFGSIGLDISDVNHLREQRLLSDRQHGFAKNTAEHNKANIYNEGKELFDYKDNEWLC